MKKTFCCLFLAYCLLNTDIAHATVYYYNNTPSTIYVAPDPYYQAGEALGNMIGSAMEASRREKEAKEYEAFVNSVKQNIINSTKRDAEYMAERTHEIGIKKTLEDLENWCFSNGWRPQINSHGEIIALYFQDRFGGRVIEHEYSYNLRTQQCRVIMSVPSLNLKEQAVEYFSEPTPTITEVIANYLGLQTTQRTETINGLTGYAVLNILPGGIADSAGLRRADIITKIDTYEVKNHDIEQICSYLFNRFQMGAEVKTTFFRNGQQKITSIK